MTEKNDEKESTSLKEILKTLIAFMDRDHVMRKAHLEHQREELKVQKWKNRLFGLLVGSSVVVAILTVGGVISERTILGDYVAIVRIDGEIMPSQSAGARSVLPALKEAFSDTKAKGVIIVINSPGGTPVQASLIHDSIVRLRVQYPDKKVVAIGEDYLTSGAYWIATSAPEIYVNKSTIAGSIGVISTGFGVDLTKLKQYGIERRIAKAGDYKNRNDMFLPQRTEDIKKMQAVIGDMHKHFIDSVMSTRRGKINADMKTVFNGDYWTGNQAVKLGLVDGVSDLPTIMREKFNVEKVADYTPHASFFESAKRSFGVEGLIDNVAAKLTTVTTRPMFLAM